MARLHRLETRDGEILRMLRMTDGTRDNLNAQLEAEGREARWKRAGYPDSRPICKSLTRVARMLNLEGFGPDTANEVMRYHRRKIARDKEEWDRIEAEFSKFMSKATPEERKTVGAFIGAKTKAAFDAGLKIGLLAGLVDKEKALQDGEGE